MAAQPHRLVFFGLQKRATRRQLAVASFGVAELCPGQKYVENTDQQYAPLAITGRRVTPPKPTT